MRNKDRNKRAQNKSDEAKEADIQQPDIVIPERLPILGIDNSVLFPFMIAPVVVTQERDITMINDVLRSDRLLGVFLKKSPSSPDSFDNIHSVGSLAVVLKMLRMPDGAVQLLLHGIDRIRITEELSEENYMEAKAEFLRSDTKGTRKIEALMRNLKNVMSRVVEISQLPEDLAASIAQMEDPGKLADLIVAHLTVKEEERQEILATYDLEERLTRVLSIMSREVQILELGSEIQSKMSGRIDKKQRDYMLREEMNTIKKELGEDDVLSPDILELTARIEQTEMPEYAQEAAQKEISRLEMIHPSSPEYAVSRNYLDCILSLPWSVHTQDNIDIKRAAEVLDEDHYGLSDIKERILEYLAVIQLKQKIRGPILCLVGPPGVGKTSLGRSIARAMGRKFQRMSLGGMRDEAEIRGHRRTYIGSMPGRLLKAIRDGGVNNPLIMLDEIDKLGTDFRGDPAAALLEVLDPEQNNSFTDHYLDMPFDLSAVMFITTANTLDSIPSPLLDRMETLVLSGYTANEKLEIAKQYLIPRAYENTGVTEENVVFTDEGISEVINGYTSEAGVRNIERELNNICRKVAKMVAMGEKTLVTIDPPGARNLLGPWRIFSETARRTSLPGVAVGLAWTPQGGQILFIEATALPGGGNPMLTGHLGHVMKESATTAHSYLQANAKLLGIPEDVFTEKHLHLHVPAGAIPKDGPSAGVAILCTLCSLLLDTPVKEKLAMTGEITLKGNILPVGGIKEKVLAAHQAGILEVILPARSKDLFNKEMPKEIAETMRFHFVDNAMEALRIAFPRKIFGTAEPLKKPSPAPVATVVVLPTPAPATEQHKPAKAGKTTPRNEYRGYRAEEADSARRDTVVLPSLDKDEEPRAPLRIEPDPSKKPRRRKRSRNKNTSLLNEETQTEKTIATVQEKQADKSEPQAGTDKSEVAVTKTEPHGETPTSDEETTHKPRRRRRGRRGGAGRDRQDRADQSATVQDGTPATTVKPEPASSPEQKPEAEKPATPKAAHQSQRHHRPTAKQTDAKPREELPKAQAEPQNQYPEEKQGKYPAKKDAGKTPKPTTDKSAQKPTQPAREEKAETIKPVAKKTTARKTTIKKTAAKATTKKTAAKSTAEKTTAVKKTAAKESAAKKKTAKKTAAKTTAKKTAVKKTAAKKTTRKTSTKE